MSHLSVVVVPALACGVCLDANVTGIIPFAGYWLVLFVLWTLLAGPISLSIVRRTEHSGVRSPAWMFLWFIIVVVVMAPVTGGAVVGPFVLFSPFWLIRIVRAARDPRGPRWKKINVVLLGILLICIPVSYVVPWKPLSEYRATMERQKTARYEAGHSGIHAGNPDPGTSGKPNHQTTPQ
ncbi:MAG: hypothetical protein V1809_15675 [Planctomycetota bacterium]